MTETQYYSKDYWYHNSEAHDDVDNYGELYYGYQIYKYIVLKSLKKKGVIIDGEPRDWVKSVSIYFRDPDNHQLEISANCIQARPGVFNSE